jgi:hypothetical protein
MGAFGFVLSGEARKTKGSTWWAASLFPGKIASFSSPDAIVPSDTNHVEPEYNISK